MKKQDCPCGSGKSYSDCCGPIITGRAPAPEPLMRSRYTAFYNGDVAYLLATLAPEKREGQEDRLKQELIQTISKTQWLGLRILDRGSDKQDCPDLGFIEFIAFFEQDNTLGQLHERSVFIRENGIWYYRDGEMLPQICIARNQLCVCGSGLKFKRCHGKK